jgi:hypothetical protein
MGYQINMMLKLLIAIFLFFTTSVYSSTKVLTYSEIEPVLRKTWEDTYPLPFTTIVKSDLLGKGIAFVKKNGKSMYLYSFEVFMPRYILEDNETKAMEEGRKIIVRLYYNPSSKEKPYFLDLGEFEEKYNRGLIIRYIK